MKNESLDILENAPMDVLETVKIRNARAIWSQDDKTIVRWRVYTGPNDVDDSLGEVYDVYPSQMRHPLEALVLLRIDDPAVNPQWKPIVATSRFYKPIPHQLVQKFFLQTLRARYPDAPLDLKDYVNEVERMVRLFNIGETVKIEGDELSFYMSVTNSYDLSLGIHTDAYIHNEAHDWGIFLGLGGQWEGTFKHYWDAEKLQKKMSERVISILQKKEARIQTIRDFAGTNVTPDTITKVGRALNCQKKEVDTFKAMIQTVLPEGVEVPVVWVRNAGFACITANAPITAWQMTGMFAKWASRLSESRRSDIAQRLFFVVERILKEEAAAFVAAAPRIVEIRERQEG